MRSFHNIEQLPGKDYYTGYAAGAIYRIYHTRNLPKSKTWRASYNGLDNPAQTPLWFYGETLAEISEWLVRIEAARVESSVRKSKMGF